MATSISTWILGPLPSDAHQYPPGIGREVSERLPSLLEEDAIGYWIPLILSMPSSLRQIPQQLRKLYAEISLVEEPEQNPEGGIGDDGVCEVDLRGTSTKPRLRV